MTLTEKIVLYVPQVNTGFFHQPSNSQFWLDVVYERFCRWFGGFTTTEATGGWIGLGGYVMRDQLTLVTSFCTPEQLSAAEPLLRSLAVDIGRALKQEAVSLETHNALEIIPCR